MRRILKASFFVVILLFVATACGTRNASNVQNVQEPAKRNAQYPSTVAEKKPESTMTTGSKTTDGQNKYKIPTYVVVPSSQEGIKVIDYFPIRSNVNVAMFLQNNSGLVSKINREFLGQQTMNDGKAVFIVQEKKYNSSGDGRFSPQETEKTQSFYSIDEYGNIRIAANDLTERPKETNRPIYWYPGERQPVKLVGNMQMNKEYIVYDDVGKKFLEQKRSQKLVSVENLIIDGESYPCIIIEEKWMFFEEKVRNKNRYDVNTLYYAKGIGLIRAESAAYEDGKIMSNKMFWKYSVK